MIQPIHSTPRTKLSFEFFPPKTDKGWNKLMEGAQRLAQLAPEYFSVTFGAGGSTRERTLETVLALRRDARVPSVPHLSCICATPESLRQILDTYRQEQINHLVALRGDVPSGMVDPGQFRYAYQLIEFIRRETGDYFHLEVAAYPEYHPQAPSPQVDLLNFKRKVEAGANSAITQYFYNTDAYLRYLDDVHRIGIDIPIVPGIMPITNFQQLARFSDACGAEIPQWIRKRLDAYDDDLASITQFGHEVVVTLCERLIQHGCTSLHFYTLNNPEPCLAICQDLHLLS